MIELKHLSKTFETAGGRVDALKDVSLTIPDGDVYGIIGMSGAGKSTLVRCINMLERPTEGEVIVNGQRLDTMTPAQLRAARREKGYRLFCENPTNQIFVVLENKKIKELERQVAMGFTEKFDDTHTVMRICTSWATRSEDVDALIALL